MSTYLESLRQQYSDESLETLSKTGELCAKRQVLNARVSNLQEQLKLNKRLMFNAKLDKAVTGTFLFLILPVLTLWTFDTNAQRRNMVEGIGLTLCGLSMGTQIVLRHQDHKLGKRLNQLKQDEQAQSYV